MSYHIEFAMSNLPSFKDLNAAFSHPSCLLRLPISMPPPSMTSNCLRVSPSAPFAVMPRASEMEAGDTSEFFPSFTVFLKIFIEKSACAFMKSALSPSFAIAFTGRAVMPSIRFSFALTAAGLNTEKTVKAQSSTAAAAAGTAHRRVRCPACSFCLSRARIFSAVSRLNSPVTFIPLHSSIYFSLLFTIKTSRQ